MAKTEDSIKFFTQPRDKKISLWVRAGDETWNLADLPPKQATADVLQAVAYAYQQGLEMGRRVMADVGYHTINSMIGNGSPVWESKPEEGY